MKGNWTKITRTDREKLKVLYEHSKGQLAGWLGTREVTLQSWMDGSQKRWRAGWVKKVDVLHRECFQPTPTVQAQDSSSLRRLYGLLQTLGASDLVLGAVARFILEEEGL